MGKKLSNAVNEVEGDTLIEEKDEVKQPRNYLLVFHNDDYTTQEFVVHVLENLLHKAKEEAHRLMLKVHMEGKAVVGVYSKDIAETKMAYITSYSRENGMPLLATVEPQ